MWEYQQGAYPVLRFFLEERVGRALDSDEFDQFRYLAAATRLTIERLPEIDQLVAHAVADAFTVDELGLPQQFGE
jgi:hypothetical protein